MKKLTFLLALAIATVTFGQTPITMNPSSKVRKIQVGVNFSPDICSRTLKNNKGVGSIDFIIDVRDRNEIIKLGYTTGLNVRYRINQKIELETGLGYSNKGYQTKMKDAILSMPEPDFPDRFKTVDNFHYLDIPVKANYYLSEKKVSLYASVGLTTNILIKSTQVFVGKYDDGKTERNTSSPDYDYNKINFSPTLGVGLDYAINERINLKIEPTFRYGVLKIIDTPITAYLWSFGLNVGCYFGT